MFIIRRVNGTSMAPALRPGQIVIGYKTHKVAAGDVVVVCHDNREKIKRIDQKAGNKVYLLGDNPGNSTDSRHFGWLPADHIIAKVIWPRRTSV